MTVDAKWVTPTELDILIARGNIAQPNIDRLTPLRDKFELFINAIKSEDGNK